LVPFYCGSRKTLLGPLAHELEAAFGLPVERQAPNFDPELAYDPSRGQYNSRLLLAQLFRQHPAPRKVLGVTDADLFIPVLTFVFGEAQLDGRVALVSSHRLAAERYGLPADPALLQARLAKEAVHELGHTFGLVHCSDGRCVMASSQEVTGIDLKGAGFCLYCAGALGRRQNAVPRDAE
jgi:archaemetzincin